MIDKKNWIIRLRYNRGMFSRLCLLLAGLSLAGLLLGSCRPVQDPRPPSATPAPLTPYRTHIPTPLAAAPDPEDGTAVPTPTIPPPPTPTPIIYQVQEGDTLLSIAFQFGVTLDELVLANPEIDPNFLSIGEAITIPLSTADEGTPEVLPTPTPLPVAVSPPACYPSGDGGAWCFVLVENDQDVHLENLAAWVRLYAADGSSLEGVAAAPPLNLVAPGERLPLVAYFPAPLPELRSDRPGSYAAQASLLSGVAAAGIEQRYWQVQLNTEKLELAESGLAAQVSGVAQIQQVALTPTPTPTASATAVVTEPFTATLTATLAATAPPPTATLTPTPAPTAVSGEGVLWLLAVAYDAEGRVAGVRKWEATRAAMLGQSVPFEITVYSLGQPIQRVEVLAEARP